MQQFILDLVTAHPTLSIVIVALNILRAIFKPLMTMLEAYVKATSGTKDDEILKVFEDSSIFRGLVWLVDYLTSIKIDLVVGAVKPAPATTDQK